MLLSSPPPTLLHPLQGENAALLERFQDITTSSNSKGDPQIKGLFCVVPLSCIDRLLTLGFGPQDEDGEMFKKVFRQSWFGSFKSNLKGGEEEGYARKTIKTSPLLKFPHRFSRYSSIESDGDRMRGCGGRDIMCLVLCRVFLGKCFVTSKEYRGFPSVDAGGGYDSMYNPSQVGMTILVYTYLIRCSSLSLLSLPFSHIHHHHRMNTKFFLTRMFYRNFSSSSNTQLQHHL